VDKLESSEVSLRVTGAAQGSRQQLQLSLLPFTEIATGRICSTQGSEKKSEIF